MSYLFGGCCDAPRPGRPKTVTNPEIIDKIHELILEDRRISAKSIAEQLGISRERVVSIIHEDLDMRKLSAKWVPKCLNADKKRQRCQSSGQVLEIFSARKAIGSEKRYLSDKKKDPCKWYIGKLRWSVETRELHFSKYLFPLARTAQCRQAH